MAALGLTCLAILLNKGQQWDWFGDPFGRVQWLLAGAVVGVGGAVIRELTARAPVLDLRSLGNRNFLIACLIAFTVSAVDNGGETLLPVMLQNLFGYNATLSGLIFVPSGVLYLIMVPVIGLLLNWQVDPRWLVAGGLVVLATGFWWFAELNLAIGPDQIWHATGLDPRQLPDLGPFEASCLLLPGTAPTGRGDGATRLAE